MRVAVIGHGRSPEGRGWGKQINACDIVIRMWDWQPWQGKRDYGRRYDYGMFVVTRKQLTDLAEARPRGPQRGWVAFLGKPVNGLWMAVPPPNNIALVNPVAWQREGRHLGGAGLTGQLVLTRGCLAAAWAMEHLKPEELILVGFDNVFLQTNQSIEDSFSPEYWRLFNARSPDKPEKTYPTGQPKTATHDMHIERPLLHRMSTRYGVKLIFAQEEWN